MSNQGMIVDADNVLNVFAGLTSREQKQVYRNALRKAARILTAETKVQLRSIVGSKVNSRNRWNGKTLGSGIKLKVDREATEAKVHIMGDFRLKFFEKGTAVRTLRRNGANRGAMGAHYFFRTAKTNKETEVFNSMDNLILESINRIVNR
jgi:DNA-binding FadR family transcriptional regulator